VVTIRLSNNKTYLLPVLADETKSKSKGCEKENKNSKAKDKDKGGDSIASSFNTFHNRGTIYYYCGGSENFVQYELPPWF